MDMPCIFGSVSGRERLKPFVPPSQAMEVRQGRLPGPHVSFTLHVGDLGASSLDYCLWMPIRHKIITCICA